MINTKDLEFSYKEIFEFANDAMIIHCAETGDILKVNKRACELYGMASDEIVGMKVGNLAKGNEHYNHENAIRKIRKAFEENILLTFEWEIRTHKNGYIPVEVNLKRLGSKSSKLVLAMTRDITVRKVAEQKLRERNKYFRRLMSISSDGIALIDQKGKIEFLSKSIKLITGRTARSLTGRNIVEFVHPQDIIQVNKMLERLSIKGSPFRSGSISVRFKNNSGQWRNHEVYFKNFLGNLRFNYVLLNFRDVTERLRREEEDREKDRNLNHLARLSIAGEVTAAIAHEINQPLCAAVNYFAGCRNRLSRENFSRKDIIYGLEMAQNELERAGKVVTVIKNFTKNSEQSPKLISIKEVIENAKDIINAQIKNRLARCDIKITTDKTVLCDEILIQQVISNLISNALDSMKGLDVASQSIDIHVFDHASNWVEVSIYDRGIGPPEEMISDKIEKSFYTTKEGGLGLGLSLCRKIMKSHRGKLTITAREDGYRGTRASFLIPVAQA